MRYPEEDHRLVVQWADVTKDENPEIGYHYKVMLLSLKINEFSLYIVNLTLDMLTHRHILQLDRIFNVNIGRNLFILLFCVRYIRTLAYLTVSAARDDDVVYSKGMKFNLIN